MTDCDVAIIGAGVVGLACAAEFARAGHSVVVLETHAQFGTETSSRNSGVIHAGLYYPPGTLKATTCVEGRRMLYERCRRLGIAHRQFGKLVVATQPSEVDVLESIKDRGLQNGAGALEIVNQAKVSELEPDVKAEAALWSPETGIVDAHELMMSYQVEAQEHGALFSYRTRLTALEKIGNNWQLQTLDQSGEEYTLESAAVLNCAGLHAEEVAKLAGLPTEQLGLRYHPCKGDYFALAPRWSQRVRHLVYPVPVHAGLGIHLTLDLGGRVLAGPDTTYVDELNYDVDPDKARLFAEAIRRYLPALGDHELKEDYAGIRPKLQGPGEAFRDFVLQEETENGAPGLINLLGIESPGLTASEALAKRALSLLH